MPNYEEIAEQLKSDLTLVEKNSLLLELCGHTSEEWEANLKLLISAFDKKLQTFNYYKDKFNVLIKILSEDPTISFSIEAAQSILPELGLPKEMNAMPKPSRDISTNTLKDAALNELDFLINRHLNAAKEKLPPHVPSQEEQDAFYKSFEAKYPRGYQEKAIEQAPTSEVYYYRTTTLANGEKVKTKIRVPNIEESNTRRVEITQADSLHEKARDQTSVVKNDLPSPSSVDAHTELLNQLKRKLSPHHQTELQKQFLKLTTEIAKLESLLKRQQTERIQIDVNREFYELTLAQLQKLNQIDFKQIAADFNVDCERPQTLQHKTIQFNSLILKSIGDPNDFWKPLYNKIQDNPELCYEEELENLCLEDGKWEPDRWKKVEAGLHSLFFRRDIERKSEIPERYNHARFIDFKNNAYCYRVLVAETEQQFAGIITLEIGTQELKQLLAHPLTKSEKNSLEEQIKILCSNEALLQQRIQSLSRPHTEISNQVANDLLKRYNQFIAENYTKLYNQINQNNNLLREISLVNEATEELQSYLSTLNKQLEESPVKIVPDYSFKNLNVEYRNYFDFTDRHKEELKKYNTVKLEYEKTKEKVNSHNVQVEKVESNIAANARLIAALNREIANATANTPDFTTLTDYFVYFNRLHIFEKRIEFIRGKSLKIEDLEEVNSRNPNLHAKQIRSDSELDEKIQAAEANLATLCQQFEKTILEKKAATINIPNISVKRVRDISAVFDSYIIQPFITEKRQQLNAQIDQIFKLVARSFQSEWEKNLFQTAETISGIEKEYEKLTSTEVIDKLIGIGKLNEEIIQWCQRNLVTLDAVSKRRFYYELFLASVIVFFTFSWVYQRIQPKPKCIQVKQELEKVLNCHSIELPQFFKSPRCSLPASEAPIVRAVPAC